MAYICFIYVGLCLIVETAIGTTTNPLPAYGSKITTAGSAPFFFAGAYVDPAIKCNELIFNNPVTGSMSCPTGFQTYYALDPYLEGYHYTNNDPNRRCGGRINQCISSMSNNLCSNSHNVSPNFGGIYLQCEQRGNVGNLKSLSQQCGSANEATSSYFDVLGNANQRTIDSTSTDVCRIYACVQAVTARGKTGQVGGFYATSYLERFQVTRPPNKGLTCGHDYTAVLLTTASTRDLDGCSADHPCPMAIYYCMHDCFFKQTGAMGPPGPRGPAGPPVSPGSQQRAAPAQDTPELLHMKREMHQLRAMMLGQPFVIESGQAHSGHSDDTIEYREPRDRKPNRNHKREVPRKSRDHHPVSVHLLDSRSRSSSELGPHELGRVRPGRAKALTLAL